MVEPPIWKICASQILHHFPRDQILDRPRSTKHHHWSMVYKPTIPGLRFFNGNTLSHTGFGTARAAFGGRFARVQIGTFSPIPSMGWTINLPIHEWLIFMVSVGKYTSPMEIYTHRKKQMFLIIFFKIIREMNEGMVFACEQSWHNKWFR